MCRLFDSDMNAVFQTGPLTHFLSSSQLWHINNETGWGQGFENKLVIIIWRVQSFLDFSKSAKRDQKTLCICCNSHSLLWGGVLQSSLKLKFVFFCIIEQFVKIESWCWFEKAWQESLKNLTSSLKVFSLNLFQNLHVDRYKRKYYKIYNKYNNILIKMYVVIACEKHFCCG